MIARCVCATVVELAHLGDANATRPQMRFYGVIQAFREGKLPDNTQIDETLNYVRDNSFVDVDKLSPEGQRLIQDVRDIVETVRAALSSRLRL